MLGDDNMTGLELIRENKLVYEIDRDNVFIQEQIMAEYFVYER